ncbi:2-dehydropantoate 2-reductase [Sporosarcina jeotgali]|uniref:2-dehydropantoate 2-reductase n=1 Tax=Sporosarcina jeotgali TaxID=3020056 RepID=A0ABZ0KZ99_9BACL|nr:2-dehydropantoate 2-reductase [Sporosarcina sp. B2O-1]WOV85188.1 2-dehydropantoate 2-reductase [Sporosarcina sp. B2O-1]
MEVVIAGAGAMGLLIGSYLAESGISVSFLTRRNEQAADLIDNGVKRIHNGSVSTFRVHAFSDIAHAPKNAFWILAVKSKDLRGVVQQLEFAKLPGHLMFIQNGMRHYDLARSVSISSVSIASLTHGAGKVDDHTVIHNGVGVMRIAALTRNQEGSSRLFEASSSMFPIVQEQDAHSMLLRKAIINCCINPLTALLELKNGELLTNITAHALMEAVYSELASGYPETVKTLAFSDVEKVCRNTSDNRSSMLTDRDNGIPMEIDTIVSAILEGKGECMPTLKVLERLLKAMDERKDDV